MAKSDAEKLTERVAAHYQQMLAESLPRISEAMDTDEARQASFTVTVTFQRGKNGVSAKLMPRERIPMPGIELKLTADDDGQLGLFAGHGAPKIVPAGKSMNDNEDEQSAPPAH